MFEKHELIKEIQNLLTLDEVRKVYSNANVCDVLLGKNIVSIFEDPIPIDLVSDEDLMDLKNFYLWSVQREIRDKVNKLSYEIEGDMYIIDGIQTNDEMVNEIYTKNI